MKKVLFTCFAFLSFFHGNSQWEWVNPKQNGYQLHTIAFADKLYGVAAGISGTMLYTDNGGETWNYLPIVTENDISKVLFINDNDGFAAAKGQLLFTTDKGKTWGVKYQSTLDPFVYMQLTSDSLLICHNYKYNEKIIGKSRDFGLTWEFELITDAKITYKLYYLNELSALSISSSGNTILKTDDNWKTYKSYTIPYQNTCGLQFSIISLNISDSDSIYASVFIEDGYGTHTDIILSIDQGETWETIISNLPIGDYKLIDKDEGYGISYKEIGEEYYSVELTQFKDGNINTFSKQYNSLSYWLYTDLALLTSDSAFVVINSILYSTQNGGIEWETYGNTSEYGIYNICRTSDSTGYMANSLGLYRAQEGGLSWQINCDSIYLPHISFYNDSVGFVCQNNLKSKLLLTKNQGKTFKKILDLTDRERVIDLFMPESTSMYIAVDSTNNKNYLLKSVDDGITWIKLGLAPNFTVEKIFFLNKTIGYLAGTEIIDDRLRTALYRTYNGGNNWYNMFAIEYVEGTPFGVKFFENNIGYINVLNGTYDGIFHLYKKVPGELTSIMSAQEWLAFDFLTADTGVVYSDNILKYTSNGGISWEILGSYPGFESVKIFNKNQIILYNFKGQIIQINPFSSPGWATINSRDNRDEKLLIYPNPASDYLFIVTKNIGLCKNSIISIYNVQGELVYQIPLLQSESRVYKINLPKLPNGIYIYSVNTASELVQGKLIIGF